MRAPAVVGLLLLALTSARAQEPAAPPSAEGAGGPSPTEQLFAQKCASCHSIGEGPRVGPDLKDVHLRRDRDWLRAMILEPSRMLSTDPVARQLLQEFNNVRMPELGLDALQTAKLIDLMERCSAQPCDLSGGFVPVTEASLADIERGRRLFLGLRALSQGGPSCLSCHDVRGAGGVVGGGTLARDLTHSFARLGDEGLGAALTQPPFPVMNKVYGASPLTQEEAFALRAFLYDANRSEPVSTDHWNLASLGVLGAALVLVILNAFWRRRLRGVRRILTQPHSARNRG